MNTMIFLRYLLVMAGMTYLVRMVPFVVFRGKVKSEFFQVFLNYIPYAVLGAMTFPAVFSSTGDLWSGIAGTIVGGIFAYLKKGLLFVAIAASIAALFVKVLTGCFSF